MHFNDVLTSNQINKQSKLYYTYINRFSREANKSQIQWSWVIIKLNSLEHLVNSLIVLFNYLLFHFRFSSLLLFHLTKHLLLLQFEFMPFSFFLFPELSQIAVDLTVLFVLGIYQVIILRVLIIIWVCWTKCKSRLINVGLLEIRALIRALIIVIICLDLFTTWAADS